MAQYSSNQSKHKCNCLESVVCQIRVTAALHPLLTVKVLPNPPSVQTSIAKALRYLWGGDSKQRYKLVYQQCRCTHTVQMNEWSHHLRSVNSRHAITAKLHLDCVTFNHYLEWIHRQLLCNAWARTILALEAAHPQISCRNWGDTHLL